ncbi:MAG: hypothetical protein PHO23_01000 [Candidatus Pacebacteria bacterium]|nr:hypothetical protein [Candidatus Paceibacterota bacterium]
MSADTPEKRKKSLADFVQSFDSKTEEDIKKINFKSLGDLLGVDIVEIAQQLAKDQNVNREKIATFLNAANEKNDKLFEKLIMAGDENNVAGRFKVYQDALKKMAYSKKGYDLYMSNAVQTLEDYTALFEPGSKERQDMDKMLNDIKDLQNRGQEQAAFNKMVQFYQMYELKKEHNARTYMSAGDI